MILPLNIGFVIAITIICYILALQAIVLTVDVLSKFKKSINNLDKEYTFEMKDQDEAINEYRAQVMEDRIWF